MLGILFFLSLIISKALAENANPRASIEFINTRKQNYHPYVIRTTFLIDIVKKELEKEVDAEVKFEMENEKKIERANEIYRKYLATRVKGSSILRDFLTLRY